MIGILEEEKQAKQKLLSTLDILIKITPDSLIRTDDLGKNLDFSPGVDVFKRTLSLLKDLHESNLDNVPKVTITNISDSVEQAREIFNQIKDFTSAQGDPAGVRNKLIVDLAKQYQELFNRIEPVIAYSIRKGTGFERLKNEARSTVESLNTIKNDMDLILKEAKAILSEIRQSAAEAGVAKHAIHFEQEAEAHRVSSILWLRYSIGITAITIVIGLWMVWYYTNNIGNLTMPQSIQLAVTKIIIFSVLYYATIWVGKIYKAQRHNYVVNKHRQNALKTFETFVKAASDEQTKNAVLLEATKSIFSPQNTGYVSGDTETGASPQILEIIRGFVTTKPGT